jgi:hypothetical protein
VAIYAMMPAQEQFEDDPITVADLEEAGLVRPSVFASCTSQIGSAAEQNYLFATKNDF